MKSDEIRLGGILDKNMDKEKTWNKYYQFPMFKAMAPYITLQYFRKHYSPLLKHVDLEGKTTLELGAGTGFLSLKLKEIYNTRPTLVDNNTIAYETFVSKQYRTKDHSTEKARYIQLDVFKLDLKEKFDLVFSDGLIEHFDKNRQRKLVGIHKTFCKKEGRVIISVPKPGAFDKVFSKLFIPQEGISPGELINILENENFEILDMISDNLFVTAIAKG